MIRKAAAICIAYYLVAIILSGCCNCPPTVERTIRWTGMQLNTRLYFIDADSNVRSIADTTTDFRSRQCLLRATVDYELVAANKSHQLHLLNEAYACKCTESLVNVPKSIMSLRVFTVNNFDTSHPSGSDVTDRFGSPYILNSSPHGIGPLELYFPVSQYRGNEPYTIYDLYLAKRPLAGSVQQFRVVVTLSDNTSYSQLSPEMQF